MSDCPWLRDFYDCFDDLLFLELPEQEQVMEQEQVREQEREKNNYSSVIFNAKEYITKNIEYMQTHILEKYNSETIENIIEKLEIYNTETIENTIEKLISQRLEKHIETLKSEIIHEQTHTLTERENIIFTHREITQIMSKIEEKLCRELYIGALGVYDI